MHYWAAPKPKVLLPVLDSRLTEDEARQMFADMVAMAHPSNGDAE
jgi:hypothetical protein